MPTYEIDIPVKCSTLHRWKTNAVDLFRALVIIGLVALVVIGDIVAHIEVIQLVFQFDTPILTLTGFHRDPMVVAFNVGLLSIADGLTLLLLWRALDIHFKINCIKEEKE